MGSVFQQAMHHLQTMQLRLHPYFPVEISFEVHGY